MSIINSSFRSLGSFLGENIYKIPDYQREYAWEETELEDLWLDLKQVVDDESDNHFLGQIVVHKTEDNKYLIDGQQRTSTAIILLSVMRKLFYSFTDENGNIYEDARYEAEDITTKYIGRYTETRDERKLYLGEADSEFFAKYIQSLKHDKSKINNKIKSNKRIEFAFDYFYKLLSKEIDSSNSIKGKYSILKRYFDDFTEDFTVMFVETDDINEAFIIFETLNARGRDLETSDLLKNHIFRMSGNKIEISKAKWKLMIDNLAKIDATKFIRHFWNSQNNFIREKDLYKAIRKKIDTPLKAMELMDDLSCLSEAYSGFENPLDDSFFEITIRNKLEDLNVLKAKSFYPIILSLVKKDYSATALYKVLESLEVLIVRNVIVSGLVANKFEIEFSKIAYSIYQEEITSLDEILHRIKKLTLKDEEFEHNFSNFSYKNKPTIRYILRKLNSKFSSEVTVIEDNSKIHIEHIMPVKPNGEWQINPDTHSENLWKIGNLTLLGNEYNKKISNYSFEKKKVIYKKSHIKITNMLLDYDKWGPSQIKDRQKKMAKLAVEIWRL